MTATASSVTAIDIAHEAVSYAAQTPGIRLAQASCSSLPFASGSFDLVVNFEVIEHIHDWRSCLSELRRVLTPHGVLVISTPNRTYYAESRGQSGPNPFHVHEFDYEEFASALAEHFPQVDILTQNHADGIVFQTAHPGSRAGLGVEHPENPTDSAHFFVAVCRLQPAPPPKPFIFLPSAANVLRERERHIALLSADVDRLRSEKQNLVEMLRKQEAELAHSNQWAQGLDNELQQARARIVELQDELAAAQKTALEQIEAERKTAAEELQRCIDLLHQAEATILERTNWAQRLDDENRKLSATLEMVQASRLDDQFPVGPLPDEN
jgi:SAM-dependent methyltransferase